MTDPFISSGGGWVFLLLSHKPALQTLAGGSCTHSLCSFQANNTSAKERQETLKTSHVFTSQPIFETGGSRRMFLPTPTLTFAFSILKNMPDPCWNSFLHYCPAVTPRSKWALKQQHCNPAGQFSNLVTNIHPSGEVNTPHSTL